MATDDLRVQSLSPLIAPAILIEEWPLDLNMVKLISSARLQAEKIIQGTDDRLLMVVGPCSIHDVEAALDYAIKLKQIIDRFSDDLCIIMRVYFEKPRTTIGWKGLINDPMLDNSFKINYGLRLARKLLIDLAQVGVPAGTEFLDPIVPQFIADAISWGAVGARTAESQLHRELASGLSMPVGFKNGTSGDIQIAIDALHSAQHPHHFLSVTKQGIPAIVSTKGNQACHLILRGGRLPNYFSSDVLAANQRLIEAGLNTGVMVDASHGNSQKNHANQKIAVENIIAQVSQGSFAISGLMLESNLVAGRQDLRVKTDLVYGQSITDPCIDMVETSNLLTQLAKAVQARRKTR
jgi:3-deoxy-7-phosphoheptulonate synthase